MQWCFQNNDYYERNVIFHLDKIIRSYQNPILLDIGANCGYYSLMCSKLCKHVFSFEPVSETFTALRKNICQNKIKNITALKLGASNKVSAAKINLYNSSGNNSIFERNIPLDHQLKKIGTELIQLDTIDNLFLKRKISAPDVIKIDVEGAELSVLQGAMKTISAYRPTILMEYSSDTASDAGYAKENLLDVLDLVNYKVFGLSDDVNNLDLIVKEDFPFKTMDNIIFVPTERNLF